MGRHLSGLLKPTTRSKAHFSGLHSEKAPLIYSAVTSTVNQQTCLYYKQHSTKESYSTFTRLPATPTENPLL